MVQMAPFAAGNSAAGGVLYHEQHRGRVTVQQRPHGAMQPISGASIYVLQMEASAEVSYAQVRVELVAHMDVLRRSRAASLILALPLLPEPGSLPPDMEAAARIRDLSSLQLINKTELEIGKLIEIVQDARDAQGGLAVTKKLLFRNGSVAAIGLQYEDLAGNTNPRKSFGI
jgi:hypothetical protein